MTGCPGSLATMSLCVPRCRGRSRVQDAVGEVDTKRKEKPCAPCPARVAKLMERGRTRPNAKTGDARCGGCWKEAGGGARSNGQQVLGLGWRWKEQEPSCWLLAAGGLDRRQELWCGGAPWRVVVPPPSNTTTTPTSFCLSASACSRLSLGCIHYCHARVQPEPSGFPTSLDCPRPPLLLLPSSLELVRD